MGTSRQIAFVVGIILSVVGMIAGGRYLIQQRADEQGTVRVPKLSAEATTGEAAFVAYCVSCHGKNAAGTDKGPSLVNQIYGPLHHGDFSFVRAVTLGVPQHHWLFGTMPPQPEVGHQEIDRIVVYIRELQRANGIQ